MATSRAALQSSLRRLGRPNAPSKRNLSSSSARHDDAYEAEKWEKITYLGIATCTILAIYNLSKGHPHHYEEPPPYPYLRIRKKDFPWGPHSLFERKHEDH
ncbi:hypothetical protein MRB53_014930 [Persea americana]|uniref:Uncharacterized protein n=1 Tax=Persea americana TaxID=3435 RepID=A0ACC2KC70_PERAE|nr:hypothetical protein MRB53_014930 [Persea americana]